MKQPVVMSGHSTLTSALYTNGNIARHWKAEGGIAEEKTYGKARWRLDIEGTCVKLFVDYIDRNETAPIAINHTRIQHEKGIPGNSRILLGIVRQQLTPSPEEQEFADIADVAFPEEVNTETTYHEGAVRHIMVNAYERNAQARRVCLAYYGVHCFICHFDFGKAYGQAGIGYVQVHHLRQLANIGERYEVDPIADLRPVCPNCHAIIHRRNPPYSIEEVHAMLQQDDIEAGLLPGNIAIHGVTVRVKVPPSA